MLEVDRVEEASGWETVMEGGAEGAGGLLASHKSGLRGAQGDLCWVSVEQLGARMSSSQERVLNRADSAKLKSIMLIYKCRRLALLQELEIGLE